MTYFVAFLGRMDYNKENNDENCLRKRSEPHGKSFIGR